MGRITFDSLNWYLDIKTQQSYNRMSARDLYKDVNVTRSERNANIHVSNTTNVIKFITQCDVLVS